LSEQQYIGRGEEIVKEILQRIFPSCVIYSQQPIKKLINKSDFDILDSEVQKHKFDFAVDWPQQMRTLIVEVNYKHKEKAAKKWNDIFVPLLKKYFYIPVSIDDYDCENLFKLNSKNEHKLSLDDFIDVINQLKKAGVKL